VEAIIEGTTSPAIDVDVFHHTDRSSGAPNDLLGATRSVSSTTTGDNLSLAGGDTTIPAGSFIWVDTGSITGTVTVLHLTLRYTND